MAAAIDRIESPGTTRAREIANRRAVRWWLYCVLATMFVLFVVGGATRLTESGLSITEWKPVHGIIPPLTESDWQEELEKYRQIPQYQEINRGMSLEDFKVIFWWEWAHRFLARAVGVAFALPLAFFWIAGRLENRLKPVLLGLLALGGLQGFVGWWMVASGLSGRVDVSQYRLAVHLTLACIIFAATMWVARGLARHSAPPADPAVARFAGAVALLVLFQIYLGALVAGLNAGMSYNTWPLMDGALVPGGLFVLDPAWLNFFENPKMAQFAHRAGAYLLLAAAIAHAVHAWRASPGSTHARRAAILLAMILVQAVAGIVALVLAVPFGWALFHHAFAILVLGFAFAHWRAASGPLPLPTEVVVRS